MDLDAMLGWPVGRGAGLVLNFVHGVNINFLEISALRALPFWGGETFSVPVGVANPLQSFDELVNALLALFIAVAVITLAAAGVYFFRGTIPGNQTAGSVALVGMPGLSLSAK